MADTIVNTPNTRDDNASAVGWVLALIVALAVIAVAVLWYRNGTPAVPNTGTDINVTVPDVTPDTGGSGGTGTGGTGSGTGY